MAFSCQIPSLEQTLSAFEIHELLAIFEPGLSFHSTSSSDTNRLVYSLEERKIRQMISNRESAKRSRLRKKKHVEDLVQELNMLKMENRDMQNQLCMIMNDLQLVQRDSNQILSESIALQHELECLRRILQLQQQ